MVPNDVVLYLNEISNRLWTGHASVMVGAGFSKNAIARDSAARPMPSWFELGDLFYMKIHGRKPDNMHYLNPLKLADEVQAAFGRPALDQLLRESIVDKDFEVSALHIKLMDLPWADVLTTNYDTLLERTCEHIVNRRFDIVVNQDDLIYSEKPRIIKLHGSFPSERPLIITEEDYRTYPRKFAPFVNTVQQSLLENTLCLIGFSGDDPNFLQWIGWISDNIGKENSPKIYLIGILSLSDAQRKLLTSKNIVPVDISNWSSVQGNQGAALHAFFDFLLDQRKKRENLEWPKNLKMNFGLHEREAKEILGEWVEVRKAYPNWIIVPREQREILWDYTNAISYDLKIYEQLSKEEGDDLRFAFEVHWRHSRCLKPLYDHTASQFAAIIKKYDVFGINQNGSASLPQDKSNLHRRYELESEWTGVCLGLLRFYREQGNDDEWRSLEIKLGLVNMNFSPEYRSEFFYERLLYAAATGDIQSANKYLQEWTPNESQPYWEAKRAAMLSEFGNHEEALKILEASLLTVRKRLNLTPVTDDYNWVSQEAYIMFLIRFIFLSLKGSSRKNLKDTDFTERWTNNLQYKCDPWAEKKYYDLLLGQRQITDEFDLSIVNNGRRIDYDNQQLQISFSYFRFIEEVGIPLSINVSMGIATIQGALENIALKSLPRSFGIINRLSETKAVASVLSRSLLQQFTAEHCDSLIDFYLQKFEEVSKSNNNSPYAEAFKLKTAPVLSRLSVKCSEVMKHRLYSFVHRVYNEESHLPEFGNLVANLLRSSTPELVYSKIPLLMDTPLIGDRNKNNIIDPFDSLPMVVGKSKKMFADIELKRIYAGATSDHHRAAAIRRLGFLHNNNLLSKAQSEKLGKAIWKVTEEENGLPANTDFYQWYFKQLPYPKGFDPVALYKNYIINSTFSIQENKKEKGVSMGNGKDRYASELLHGSNSINNEAGIKWGAEEFKVIIAKCEEWLNLDKHYLTDEKYKTDGGFSVHNEFFLRFRNLSVIIARVFGFQKYTFDTALSKRVLSLIVELDTLGTPVLKAKVMFSKELSLSPDNYLQILQTGLTHKQRPFVIDALESAIFSVLFSVFKDDHNFERRLLGLLSEPLKWRVHYLMGDCMDAIREIIDTKPDIFKSIEGILLGALQYIKEINVAEDPSWNNYSDYLTLRQKTLSLGKQLYKCYGGKDKIPQIVTDWENIANDPNEFQDVVLKWSLVE